MRLPKKIIVENGERVVISVHRPPTVYFEQYMAIQLEYNVLPQPVDKMKLSEIRSYYDFIRPSLKERTKPKS